MKNYFLTSLLLLFSSVSFSQKMRYENSLVISNFESYNARIGYSISVDFQQKIFKELSFTSGFQFQSLYEKVKPIRQEISLTRTEKSQLQNTLHFCFPIGVSYKLNPSNKSGNFISLSAQYIPGFYDIYPGEKKFAAIHGAGLGVLYEKQINHFLNFTANFSPQYLHNSTLNDNFQLIAGFGLSFSMKRD